MSRQRAFGAVVVLACLASLAVFFRPFVFSAFDLLPGSLGDGRLLITILEHWTNAFRGRAHALSPPFFAPERGVLGYSESMFLVSLPYAALRLLGLDRYLAYGFALMAVRATGFVGMYALLRGALGADRWMALLGAVLLTISNAAYLAAGHAQLYAVAVVPWLGVLAASYWRHLVDGRTARARVALAGATTLVGLLLFTCFYVGWFTIFLATVAGGSACLIELVRGGRAPRPVVRAQVLRDAALAGGVFLIALAPSLATYVPVYRNLGGRPFAEVVSYAPAPADVLDVGASNLVWGRLVSGLADRADRSAFGRFELERGWPPVLLLVFLASLAWFSWHAVRRRPSAPALAAVLGLTATVGWLLSVRIGELTLWWFVFRHVPAASAIRVPVRINVVLNVLVIAVGMLGLSRWKRAARSRGDGSGTAGLVALSLVLVAEQLNAADVFRLSRARETALFAAIAAPPAACRYFYVTPPASPLDLIGTIGIQTEAMLVAVERGLPTVNGYSGNFPDGWNLAVLDADYRRRVADWCSAHRIPPRSLCALDAATGRWSAPDPLGVSARSRAPSGSPAPRP